MKELTREDWMKNPTPRMMWVWDDNEHAKEKRFVMCCLTLHGELHVFTLVDESTLSMTWWSHCAEIEEPQFRRMTNYELAKWIYEGASCGEFRQCKYDASYTVFTNYAYYDGTDNEPCSDNVLIRSNSGEWHEPLIEVEE